MANRSKVSTALTGERLKAALAKGEAKLLAEEVTLGWGAYRPPPVETMSFRKAALNKPALSAELNRLCGSYDPVHLAALADALGATVKGHVPKGAREYPVPGAVQLMAKMLLAADEDQNAIAHTIAPRLPTEMPDEQAGEARLKRAKKLVKALAKGRSVEPDDALAFLSRRSHTERES
jgi:hypothetical protein